MRPPPSQSIKGIVLVLYCVKGTIDDVGHIVYVICENAGEAERMAITDLEDIVSIEPIVCTDEFESDTFLMISGKLHYVT